MHRWKRPPLPGEEGSRAADVDGGCVHGGEGSRKFSLGGCHFSREDSSKGTASAGERE